MPIIGHKASNKLVTKDFDLDIETDSWQIQKPFVRVHLFYTCHSETSLPGIPKVCDF